MFWHTETRAPSSRRSSNGGRTAGDRLLYHWRAINGSIEQNRTLHVVIAFIYRTLEQVFHALGVFVVGGMGHQFARLVYAFFNQLIRTRQNLRIVCITHGRDIVNSQTAEMPFGAVKGDLSAMETANDELASLLGHAISQMEQKFDKTRFVRVDSDTIDNLIRKDNVGQVTLNEDQKNALQEMFKSQLPKIEKTDFIVTFEALGENSNPVMLTQSEYMRRMREMSAMQPGMSFYGEMPDNYNLVLNTDHELVKKVLSEEEQNCEEKLKPILADLKGWKARQEDLREAQNKKKEEEITSAEKEDMTNTNHKIDELTSQRNAILAEYAGSNKLVSQLIDLALLANGMLKGEALSQFIKRSVQLIG